MYSNMYIHLAIITTVIIYPQFWEFTHACYEFPVGRVNPCDGAKCNFGAKCVPTKDGTMHRCECPARCDNYGDTIDSMPVCGSDHVEYANRCELRRASCKEMTEINIKFFGKCGKY